MDKKETIKRNLALADMDIRTDENGNRSTTKLIKK